MPFFSRGPSIPSGWVAAPGTVQAEVFLVWQEDELPDELKNAPGYVPFTLSPESEAWVRGMAEIKEIDGDKEKIVIGRPRPAAAVQHRSLIQPSTPPVEYRPAPPSATAPYSTPAWDSGIAAKEWIRRQAPREAPAVAVRTHTASEPDREDAPRQAARSLPSIGGTSRSESTPPEKPANRARALPDIGPAGETKPAAPAEDRPPQREAPRRVPDIGAP